MMFSCICSIILVYLNTLDKIACSRVLDAVSQRSVYVSNYCPKMQYCKEGTHVMCMFYDKDKEMGPHCLNSPNITITPVLASKLLEISNAIRSKVALGREKGKDGHPLPKGFGMLRLQWDEELATFAQVLANQCILKHDLCRATKKFPNPGQTAGLVRYTYPDWNSISRTFPSEDDNVPGLTEDKLIYAIKQSTKSWYIQKSSVSSDMIANCPDWLQHPTKHAGKLYLEMITGHATHMGCGISAYTEYTYRNNFAAMSYNSVQVICNFSARPTPGAPVYNTEPPIDAPPGTQCGCPNGFDEDEDCLCTESINNKPYTKDKPSCNGKNCVPPIVLLPIIAMEDAPPHKLKSRRFNNTDDQFDNMDIFSNDNSDNSIHGKETSDFEKTLRDARNNLQQARAQTHKENTWKILNGYFRKSSLAPENKQTVTQDEEEVRTTVKHNTRKSIFSNVNNFKLPVKVLIKKDVLPRKDFAKVQNLVNKYLNKKRNISIAHSSDEENKRYIKVNEDIFTNDSLPKIYIKPKNENADKKVMYLLDNLEQEVNHINFDQNEKEILDSKLRKIYGRISNEPKNLLISARKYEDNTYKSIVNDDRDNFLKYENRVNEHLMNIQREPQMYLRDMKNGRALNFDDIVNYPNRMIEKDRDYDDNLGILKKRLEKPINDNIYDINANLNFNRLLDRNTRNMNAIVEYSHGHDNTLRDHTNYHADEEINRRNIRKNDLPEERLELSRNDDDPRQKNYFPVSQMISDGELNYKRRKYYQEKLDYLERKLQKARNRRRHNKPNENRHLRPFKMDRNEVEVRPGQQKIRKNAFYIPDRARSVHGI